MSLTLSRFKMRLKIHPSTFFSGLFPKSLEDPLAARTSTFQTISGSLLAALFPTACPICGKDLGYAFNPGACALCRQGLKSWKGAACALCGVPLVSNLAAESTDQRCGLCRRQTYHFDLARSFGVYSNPLRAFILHMKFRRRARWGLWLGGLLVQAWQPVQGDILEETPLLIPVPLHPSRQRERGFNQAELLAKGFLCKLRRLAHPGIPQLELSLLLRVRAAPSQSGLSRSARQENVRAAFVVRKPDQARQRSVLLVDDVMTTGATASSCAHALKRAGAKQVVVLTLARATPQFPDALNPSEALVG